MLSIASVQLTPLCFCGGIARAKRQAVGPQAVRMRDAIVNNQDDWPDPLDECSVVAPRRSSPSSPAAADTGGMMVCDRRRVVLECLHVIRLVAHKGLQTASVLSIRLQIFDLVACIHGRTAPNREVSSKCGLSMRGGVVADAAGRACRILLLLLSKPHVPNKYNNK